MFTYVHTYVEKNRNINTSYMHTQTYVHTTDGSFLTARGHTQVLKDMLEVQETIAGGFAATSEELARTLTKLL